MQIHDKDINSIDFSADCSLLGSGSQDKLAKLFSVDHSAKMGTTLKLAGILKGHSRGIWSIKFSKHDPYVMTGSGDCTIKLWSTDQKMRKDSQAEQGVMTSGFGSCLQTFEGHSNSILRLDFTNFGQQIVSASSDCLLKLWDIKTQVCVATLGDDSEEEEQEGFAGTAGRPKAVSDGHDGKIWALDLEDWTGSQMVSGGADSRLIYWRDVTGALSEKKNQMKEAEVAVQQDLENFVRAREFGAAIRLLIKLDKPARLLRLFTDLERAEGDPDAPDDQFGALDRDGNSVTGSADIDAVIENLGPSELVTLLRHIKSWNAVARTSSVAQNLLFLIFRSKTIHQLLAAPQPPPLVDPLEHPSDPSSSSLTGTQSHNSLLKNNKKDPPANLALELRDLLKVLLAYSDRNLVKIDKTVQESFLIEFLLNQFN